MNKKNLTIISILLAGCVFSVAYGASTIITDSSITTTNLTITGTCTGCDEGSFHSYNTVLFNGTIDNPGTTAYSGLLISNNGTVSIQASHNIIMTDTGTAIVNATSGGFGFATQAWQSANGVYKVIVQGGTPGIVTVVKNEAILQNLGINVSQFFGSSVGNAQVAISPNGQYIVVVYKSASGSNVHALIFKGS